MNLNLVQIHRLNPTAGVCFHTLNAGVVVAHSPVSCCFYPFDLSVSGLFWGVLMISCVSVFQYRIGQLYMISKHSHEQSDRGEGVEVVQNEPFEDPEHGQGQFTEKRVYLNRSAILFGVARALPHTFTTGHASWSSLHLRCFCFCSSSTLLLLLVSVGYVFHRKASSLLIPVADVWKRCRFLL